MSCSAVRERPWTMIDLAGKSLVADCRLDFTSALPADRRAFQPYLRGFSTLSCCHQQFLWPYLGLAQLQGSRKTLAGSSPRSAAGALLIGPVWAPDEARPAPCCIDQA